MDFIKNTPFPDMFEEGEVCYLCNAIKQDQINPMHQAIGPSGIVSSQKCLLQGDIIKIADSEYHLFGRKEKAVGYLVISNSCDLEKEKRNTAMISLVPIYSFDVWYDKISMKPQDKIVNELFEASNYHPKSTFFLSPLNEFGGKPSFAFIDDIQSIKKTIDVFRWDEVPGNDNRKLIRFLRQIFGIDFEKVIFEKIENNTVIQISTEKNAIFIILNSNKSEATFVIDDCRINKFNTTKDKTNLILTFSFYELLLKYRLCSLKGPWREKLGYKVGDLFNRVSTYTPIRAKIESWTKKYQEKI
jgi:hypothetical protein